ncbi:MAG: hypothetical protein KBG15_00920 [Kofleriaceae bacterium]|nr:hypothetical protein [Kofleriaceae bacterium]
MALPLVPRVAVVALATVTAACSFSSNGVETDATRTDATRLDSRLTDGPIVDARRDAPTVDAAPRRTRLGLVLRYDFNEAAGATVVLDTSGVEPQRNLQVIANPNQAPTFDGASLTTNGSTALIDEVANLSAGAKIVDACMMGALTVEAWISQDSGAFAGGRVITLTKSNDVAASNFLVGSDSNNPDTADFGVRTAQTSGSGQTLFMPNSITTTPQMLVARYNGAQLKLQSLLGPTTDPDDMVATMLLTGTFANWDRTFKLVLLNSPEYSNLNNRAWRGTISSLSVYCRSLSDAEVANDRLLGSESL